MRIAWLLAAAFATATLSACGGGSGGGSGGGGTGFAGYAPTHVVVDNPGGPADAQWGTAVAWADWNQDGMLDAFVGSPGQASGGQIGSGSVTLMLQGPAGVYTPSRTWTAADWPSGGVSAYANFGDTLCAGDFDGDGRTDVAIGAPGDPVGVTATAGRVYVLFNDVGHVGVVEGPFADPAGAQAGAGYGSALACGRVDADTKDDLAVSAPDATVAALTSAGRVAVLLGALPASFGVATVSGITETVPEDAGRFGAALAIADMNGDGYADLIAGIPGSATAAGGKVQIQSRGLNPTFSLLASITTAEPGALSEFGSSVAVGDLDGDGDMDLVVGCPYGDLSPTQTVTGYAVVFTNLVPASGTFSAGTRIEDPTPESGAGFGAVIAIGDVDGDGDLDLAVGAPSASVGLALGAGHFDVFLGAAGTAFSPPTPADVYASTSPIDDAAFAASLDLKDVNGDGFADALVGVPGPLDLLVSQPGAVEVLLSTTN